MLPLLARYADAATTRLPAAAADYLATGAGEEVSLGEAEAAWRERRFRPHVLAPVTGPADTSTTLLGLGLDTPVLVAPTAYHRLFHERGELATAEGTGAAGSLFVASSRLTVPVEELGAAGSGPWWWQSYLVRDRRVTAALAERAAAAGATAVVLTGDTPYLSRRARGSSAALPGGAELSLVNMGQHLEGGAGGDLRALEQAPATLDDIGWLADLTGLPVLVKGVLRGDDALACLDAGAAGVVVSNHGGRQLDRVVATAHALPEVVAAVAGRAPVLVDGGIRSGTDALVALALGADAVLVGRPVVWGLAADGAAGVEAVLRALTDDLAHALGLLGAPTLAALDPSLLAAGGRNPEETPAGRG